MRLVKGMLWRFCREEDRRLLDEEPGFVTYLQVSARVALRFAWVWAIAVVLLLVVTVASGLDVYRRTSVPQFCGLCHEMQQNFSTWQVSRHGSIRCVDCHAAVGFSGFVEAKLGGVRQLMRHARGDPITALSADEKHHALIDENCQRCHRGAARLGERHTLAMAHEKHLRIGVGCTVCHNEVFAHPRLEGEQGKALAVADNAACYSCHDGRRTVRGKVAFDALGEGACLRCHLDAGVSLAHGKGDEEASKEVTCVDCHERSKQEPHFRVEEATVATLCGKCHEPKAHVSAHEPYAKGRCLDCHRVMAPAYRFAGASEVSAAWCLECHKDSAARLAGKKSEKPSRFIKDGVDLHREHAQYLEDDPRWCLSCHATHGSDAKVAFIRLQEESGSEGQFEALPSGGACTGECHNERAEYARSETP